MGKKQQGTKRSRSDSEDLEEEDADEELEAEMAVLAAIQAEKADAEGDHDGIIATGKPVKKAYNREGLLQALEGIGELPFIESFSISDFPIDVQDEHDDLEREMAFYNQSVSAVREGRRRLEALNVPTKRPSDYFCENVKTDMHMNRIKDRLLLEEKKMKGFEQRKQRETTRKFSKQLQDLKKQEKTQRIKKDTEEAGRSSTFGRGDSSSGSAGNSRGGGSTDRTGAGGGQSDGKSARRLNMDKKYGLKGREKKKAKLSDRKSLNDLSDYNPRGGKMVRREKASASPKGGGRAGGGGGGGGGGGKGGKGKGKGNRPGKEARGQRRASRSASA